jgi:hypothetical protein
MRVFISHAWEDKPRALELARLPPYVHAWVDVRELLGGQDLDPTIIEAIEDSHVFLTLVSRVSMGKSYVNKELAWALEREAAKDRVFVLPVMLESGINLAESSSETFRQLGTRLFVDATDRSEAGLAAARTAIADTLFHWASDWLDRFEPRGDHDRRFVDALEALLVEYRVRLFAVKAALAWPLPTLVQPDALAHLVRVKDRYNELTDDLAPKLARMDEELRWRFGAPAQKGFKRLRDFVVDEVFQGAAFALNDVIESINAWEPVLRHDADATAAAEARRNQRLAALEPVLAELVERTTDFVQTLKP